MGKALLIIVVGFSTIFSGMMFNITARQQVSSRAIVNQYEKWLARNTVESATNVALSKLYQDFDWRTGYSGLSFGGATYSVTVTDITTDSTTEAKKIQVKTISQYADEIDSTFAVIAQPAYSHYYYFVRNWPAFLIYDSGDTLTGPVHANDPIRISNSPVFLDKVSSDTSGYRKIGATDPKFYGGMDFGTPTIATPNLAALIDSTIAGGHVFTDEVWLTFNPNGSYDWDIGGGPTTAWISDGNGTIMTTFGSDKDIHVKGTVNGKVTILSDNDLFIENDLIYASDPQINPDSDDYLGLIARDDIVVPDSAISNIDIQAAILALDEFQTENFDSGPARGTLKIFGSLVMRDDNESGTFSGGVLQNGFERVHLYDSRLRDKTSPFFPRLNRVEVLYRGN